MIRTHSRPKSSNHRLPSRPFFSKTLSAREMTPFFSTHRSGVVQRMGETPQLPEEEELQVQTKSAGDTLQRETMPDEEEEVAQPKALTETPIQRMCAECEKEQQQKSTLQPKLTVGQSGDKYEQEADRVADQVVNHLQTPNSSSVQAKVESDRPHINPLVMRQGEGSAAVNPQIAQGIQQTRGSGQPIPQPILRSMEQAFGADFSGVRVHANSESAQLNRSLNARAFTTGQDIYFNNREYQPGNKVGQKLLAHELTHVMQQNQTLSPVIHRQPIPTPNPGDDPRIHPSGAPNATSCAAPSHCPTHFCEPYDSESYAIHQRTRMLPVLMAGIALAVNRRVVPLWHEYLLGGSTPKNLTSEFGADFAASPTTAATSDYLKNALQSAITRSPFASPPGGSTRDMTAWVASEVASINTAGDPHEMNFSFPRDVAGNLAGGIGINQTACKAGAKPSPFNDQRLATVGAEFTPNADGSTTVQPIIKYTVKDTIDLCPGDCGTKREQMATVPMSQFEATGISGDVPFTVEFEHRPASFRV